MLMRPPIDKHVQPWPISHFTLYDFFRTPCANIWCELHRTEKLCHCVLCIHFWVFTVCRFIIHMRFRSEKSFIVVIYLLRMRRVRKLLVIVIYLYPIYICRYMILYIYTVILKQKRTTLVYYVLLGKFRSYDIILRQN